MGRYDDFNEYERTMWSSPRAAAYERGLVPVTSPMAEPLLDAVGAEHGHRLLDVGTGPGVVAGRAVERGCAVVGVDVSPQMLDLARAAVPEADFREGSAEELPVGDGEFDAVVGNFIVLHLGYPEKLAADAWRVLRPGGRVALTVWVDGPRNRALQIFRDALAVAGVAAPDDIPEGPLPVLFANHDAFTALLADAGFTDVRITEHAWTLTVDPARWWDDTVASTPRTGALIARQPPDVQERLRAVYDELVVEHLQTDGNAVLPAAAVLASATKPQTPSVK